MSFDPSTATEATNLEEAVELAKAWASGRRSWINTLYYLERERQFEVCAVMDAQEVVKWATLAQMFAAVGDVKPEVFFPADDLAWETYSVAGEDSGASEPSGLQLTHKPSGAVVATSGPGSMLEKKERLLRQLAEAATVLPGGNIVIDCKL